MPKKIKKFRFNPEDSKKAMATILVDLRKKAFLLYIVHKNSLNAEEYMRLVRSIDLSIDILTRLDRAT